MQHKKNLKRSLLAVGMVALLVMNVMPTSGTEVTDTTEDVVQGVRAVTAGPLVETPPTLTESDLTKWVFASVAENGDLVALNPLATSAVGANPTGGGTVALESSAENPAAGFPFNLNFDATGLASDGDRVELFVLDNLAQENARDLLELAGINNLPNPETSIETQNSRVLAYFDDEIKPNYGNAIVFRNVPAVAGAEYVLKVHGNVHFMKILLTDTARVSASTSAPVMNQQSMGWSPPNGTHYTTNPTPSAPSVGMQTTAGTVVFEDNFNDGVQDASRWSSYIGASENANCGYTSSSRALYFSGTNGRYATTTGVDTSAGGEVSFNIRHGTGTGGGICDKPESDTNDNMALQYSTNGGSSWSTLSTFPASWYGSWTSQTITLPSGAESFSTIFRWRVLNYAADTQRDHWAIDDVQIVSNEEAQEGRVAFEDNFNDGSRDGTKWASYSGASENGNCGSTSSPYALYFSGTSGRTATTKAMDVGGGGSIGFSVRHGSGTGGGFCDRPEPADADDFAVEYSTNGGSTWTRLTTFLAGNHPSWSTYTTALPTDAWSSNTQFRWRVLNYYPDTQRDHWAIDDVVVAANEGVQVSCGQRATVFETSWQPGAYRRDWEDQINTDEDRVKLGWGGWKYYYKYRAEECDNSSIYRVVDEASFGFGFYGENLVHGDRVLRFGGQVNGNACTYHRCNEEYEDGPRGMEHFLQVHHMKFLYEQPAGVDLYTAGAFGPKEKTCKTILTTEDKVAITAAAFLYPWLGLLTLVPDEVCKINWDKIRQLGDSAGLGIRVNSVESTGPQQPIGGYVNADYELAAPGDLPVKLVAQAQHNVAMRGCDACWTVEDVGTYYYTVTPAMRVKG